MPSINLLPEDFALESYKKKEKTFVYILAAFFLSFSFLIAVGAEVEKINNKKDLGVLDGQITAMDEKIKREIDSSSLFSSEYNKEDIEKLLSEHLYFSKGMEFIKSIITNDVYLKDIKIVKDDASGDFIASISVGTKDYRAAGEQVALLKDSFWVKEVNVEGLKTGTDGKAANGENQEDILSGTVVLRKELFSFNPQYWDFGLDVLTRDLNRYVKITDYAAVLRQAPASDLDSRQDRISITFKGQAYKKSELDMFEAKLKEKNVNADKIDIKRQESSDTAPGVIKFSGEMVLKY